MSEKRAVIFGAGNIGRGFLGQLFFESGYHMLFVEAKEEIVSLLNKKRAYPLWIVSDKKTEKLEISNLCALSPKDGPAVAEAVASADLCATAVGVNNLKDAVVLIAEGIRKRAERRRSSPLNIIICENLLSAGRFLERELKERLPQRFHAYLKEKIGLVETVVSRMVPPTPDGLKRKEPLLVLVEPYQILPVAKDGFKGKIPEITGFVPVKNIHAYEELKLFGHNLIHAVCAYLGFQKGCQYIWESLRNKEVHKVVSGVWGEVRLALMKKHGFSQKELDHYYRDLLRRFANKALSDTVYRVGREPLRKLSPSDRLVGAVRLCQNFGINPQHIIFTIGAALCYNYQDDAQAKELERLISEKGAGYVLQKISHILPQESIYQEILKNYKKIKDESSTATGN